MKLLIVSHNPLVAELGGPKVVIEFAAAAARVGGSVELWSANDLGVRLPINHGSVGEFSARVAEVINHRAGDYDVIEIDHTWFPRPVGTLTDQLLLVARSVLLATHFEYLRWPRSNRLRHVLGRVLRGDRVVREQIERALCTMRAADLINVCNTHDRSNLLGRGFADEKILVQPFGLTDARRAALASANSAPDAPDRPQRIAFVGTFDYRKGAIDFPGIVQAVLRSRPGATFRLIGTSGLFPDEPAVRRCFPADAQAALQIIPKFAADELPGLLDGCDVGIFPSYLEGFPFGVLEMLAAGLPVIAYDAPGPPMMLPAEWLVRPGDIAGMSARVERLLAGDRQALRGQARACAARFRWDDIARETLAVYEQALAQKRDRVRRSTH